MQVKSLIQCLGGHFKTLLDWKFDRNRVLKDRTFRNNKQHGKIVDRELFNYELFGVKSEILELVIPPKVPRVAREIYDLLTHHVVLVGGGMGGVGFRENRADLTTILKEYDIDYIIVKSLIDDIEYRLMNQYNEDNSDKKG